MELSPTLKVVKIKGVYADQLRDLFTKASENVHESLETIMIKLKDIIKEGVIELIPEEETYNLKKI